jgi:hypothetical protein
VCVCSVSCPRLVCGVVCLQSLMRTQSDSSVWGVGHVAGGGGGGPTSHSLGVIVFACFSDDSAAAAPPPSPDILNRFCARVMTLGQ